MGCFKARFEFYLGSMNYNSFVMMMNYARRKLYHDAWVRLEDVLPPVDLLGRTYGRSDPRTLDVIGMRIEVAHRRKWFHMVEAKASILIDRAVQIKNDDWQRYYNLTRAWFDLGSAQYFLKKKKLASTSFHEALLNDDELKKVEECNIFDPERNTIANYLQDMESWDGDLDLAML